MNRDKVDAANCQGGDKPVIHKCAQLNFQFTHLHTTYVACDPPEVALMDFYHIGN